MYQFFLVTYFLFLYRLLRQNELISNAQRMVSETEEVGTALSSSTTTNYYTILFSDYDMIYIYDNIYRSILYNTVCYGILN